MQTLLSFIIVFAAFTVLPYALFCCITDCTHADNDSNDQTDPPEQTEHIASQQDASYKMLLDNLQKRTDAVPTELTVAVNRIVDAAKRIVSSDNPHLKEFQSSTSTYYLPTAIKLLDQYLNQTNVSASTENINHMITEGLQQIAEALEAGELRCKQKRALQEMDDLRAEVAVLESKRRMDGLI